MAKKAMKSLAARYRAGPEEAGGGGAFITD
jgi:hypothetical protein